MWKAVVRLSLLCLLFINLNDAGIVDKIPKKFYDHLRNMCNHIDKFKDCMVENGSIKEAEANELKQEFLNHKVCPLPKGDDELKKRLEEFAKNEAIVARLKKLTKHLRAALDCFKKVLNLADLKP